MAGERSFANLGSSFSELDEAWKDRLSDAEHLVAMGRHPTAITMGLFALEILLKTRICQLLDLDRLPKPFEIHDLDGLLILSGLRRGLNQRKVRQIKISWEKIGRFANELNRMRSTSNSSKSKDQATEFLAYLNDTTIGVIPWMLRQT